MSLACNSTTLFQAITNVYGGQLNVTNSAVTTYNSTNTFEGNEITLENNNDITIQQSNTMNETTVVGSPFCYDYNHNGTLYCMS